MPHTSNENTTIDKAFRLYPLGEGAIVLELEQQTEQSSPQSQQRLWRLAGHLKQQVSAKVLHDCVLGRHNLTVIFNPLLISSQECRQLILTQWHRQQNSLLPADCSTQRTIEIPVCYGGEYGPDLPTVAAHCNLNIDEVIARHCASEYVVCFVGFQPGFAYLDGLDPQLHSPRRSEPRRCITAGSVAIGGAQSAIYPLNSPGGWQIIGRYALQENLPLFDPKRQPAAQLQSGDLIKFIAQKG